jgi:hypothetical protein
VAPGFGAATALTALPWRRSAHSSRSVNGNPRFKRLGDDAAIAAHPAATAMLEPGRLSALMMIMVASAFVVVPGKRP